MIKQILSFIIFGSYVYIVQITICFKEFKIPKVIQGLDLRMELFVAQFILVECVEKNYYNCH